MNEPLLYFFLIALLTFGGINVSGIDQINSQSGFLGEGKNRIITIFLSGQISAWYIMCSLGFYPVNPANSIYVFGSPLLDKATLKPPKGKEFTIESVNNSKENIYLQSVELNGKNYKKVYIKHSDIVKGGSHKFYMGAKPNYKFGADYSTRPQSEF